jgi:hypothetical protein
MLKFHEKGGMVPEVCRLFLGDFELRALA